MTDAADRLPRDASTASLENSGGDTLDGLIDRLERAAEQLRSGELSADAAATLVEDCASLATRTGAELDRRARAAIEEPLPGQDTLL